MSKADIKTEKIKEKSIPIAGPDINSITYDPLNKLYYCGSMEEIKIVKESDYCISSEYKFPKLGDGRKEEKLENVENLGDIEGNIKETKEIMGREEGELVKKHYYQPHSLRFLHPPHKSPKVILSPSGLMVYSLQSTKAPGKFTLVRTNFGFSSGVHYFEINCLSSCANLKFGLIQGEGQHFGRECMVQFRTTTPRVVGMELDLRLLQLNFWLNGREQKSKTLKLDPGYWIPAIYIQGIGNSVVLNPFVSAPNNQYSYDLRPLEYISRQLKFALHSSTLISCPEASIKDIEKLKEKLGVELPPDIELTPENTFFGTNESGPPAKTSSVLLMKKLPNEYIKEIEKQNKDIEIYEKVEDLIWIMKRERGENGEDPKAEKEEEMKSTLIQYIMSQQKIILEKYEEVRRGKVEISKEHSECRENNYPLSLQYLPFTEKLLMRNGSKLKVIGREERSYNLEGEHMEGFPTQVDSQIILILTDTEANIIINLCRSPHLHSLIPLLGLQSISALLLALYQGQGKGYIQLQLWRAKDAIDMLLKVLIHSLEVATNTHTIPHPHLEDNLTYHPGEKTKIPIEQKNIEEDKKEITLEDKKEITVEDKKEIILEDKKEIILEDKKEIAEEEMISLETEAPAVIQNIPIILPLEESPEKVEIIEEGKPMEKIMGDLGKVENQTLDTTIFNENIGIEKRSVDELNTELSILSKVDEQLWAMCNYLDPLPSHNPPIYKPIQEISVEEEYKLHELRKESSKQGDIHKLWDIRTSRNHTTYGRLSSFITWPTMFPSAEDVAECGVYNIGDKKPSIRHFLDPQSPLENILSLNHREKSRVWESLEVQLPNNRMLLGEPCSNVPLKVTLKHFPPSNHTSTTGRYEDIKYLLTHKQSSYMLTGSEEGSVNIWNTNLRLFQVGITNFKTPKPQNPKPQNPKTPKPQNPKTPIHILCKYIFS